MERTPLLPLPEGMFIDQIQEAEASLTITVIATHPTACCPLCLEPSFSIHSLYCRTLADVPCGGRQIQLLLTIRKFFCRNSLCERKVFTERLPQFVEPWARMTIRLCHSLQSIGLATCGKGGAKLAARLGIYSTRQTIWPNGVILTKRYDVPYNCASVTIRLPPLPRVRVGSRPQLIQKLSRVLKLAPSRNPGEQSGVPATLDSHAADESPLEA
jgi:zinc-finger of transposase IS204/IS1001/IS1096/IS1165